MLTDMFEWEYLKPVLLDLAKALGWLIIILIAIPMFLTLLL
jgi:hypothetical protein